LNFNKEALYTGNLVGNKENKIRIKHATNLPTKAHIPETA